jgi:TonB family protein
MLTFFAFAPFGTLLPGLEHRLPSQEFPLGLPAKPVAGKPDRYGVYTIGGDVSSPVLRYAESVPYSERMRELDAQGSVLVTTILGPDGVPAGTDVLMPLVRPFDLAAVRTTNRLRFDPATFNGAPVPVRLFIEFSFHGSHGVAQPSIIQRANPIEPPIALTSLWAAYPRRARKRRLRGTVVISFVITKEGLPADLHLTRSVAHDLDESALRAVRRLRFKPATRDGRPVPAHVTIDVCFLLYY